MNASMSAARRQSEPDEPQNAHSLRAARWYRAISSSSANTSISPRSKRETLADMLEQRAELLLVLLGDDLARLSPTRALRALSSVTATTIAHGVARDLDGTAGSIA